MTTELNWAGSYAYRASPLHRPTTLTQAQETVARARHIRALGSRHSFNDIADSPGELIDLSDLPADIDLDPAAGTVTVPGGMRYGTLAQELDRRGYALHTLASLPHISVAGACATGTHGSGDTVVALPGAVLAMELIGPDGELVTLRRGEADFDGAVVGLGAVGVVHRLTLQVEPRYQVRQVVYENLPWAAGLAGFDEVTASAYSVSLFTSWRGGFDQVWCKSREDGGFSAAPGSLLGAPAATVEHHPLPGIDPASCTEQLGVPGAWHDRLPHFRMDFTPSNGDELQSEYLVARENAVGAIEALRGVAEHLRPHLQVTEIRTVAPDALWLSPAYGRATVAFHFTWLPHPTAVAGLLPVLEAALEPFDARPHWGKLFAMGPGRLAEVYPRLPEFARLVRRRDPEGVFGNAFLERTLLG